MRSTRSSAAGRALLAAVVATASVLGFAASSPAARRESHTCPTRDSAGVPSLLDLYCVELVPTPDLRSVAATLELQPIRNPFGISVTPDGNHRYALTATIEGLPDPSTLGAFATYVAWATTLAMDEVIRLGEVRNGRTSLGEVSFNQFRVFVSAERTRDVRERTGRLVLRATSPSSRLLAHRDLLSPYVVGSGGSAAAPGGGEHRHVASADSADGWVMPPPFPGIATMAGMDHMAPSVAPFRPGRGLDPRGIRAARPRQVVSLTDGDTLTLDAEIVRRTIAGKTFTMYGFNGQYPGPLIKVPQRATITVNFRNRIDLPSAVHWHGVRLENSSDGVPGVTQPEVPPGGSYVYTVHFKDAGLYWYHPHHREDIQQDLGLYGNMLVAPPSKAYYAPANREEVLMLDDFLLADEGPVPHGLESPTHALMGRFGNLLLVNGELRYALTVRRGEVVRFFLTNVSSTRVFNLSFGAARVKLVASDVGRFEHEEWVRSVTIAPAERYVVDVEFAATGDVAITNRVQALNHMIGNFFPQVDTLGAVRVRPARAVPSHAASFRRLRRNNDVVAELDGYRRQHLSRAADKSLTLGLRLGKLPIAISSMFTGLSVPVDWNDGMPMANWVTTGREVSWLLREPSTGAENMDVAWRFRLGDVMKVRIFNDPAAAHAMDHPIHVHGQRFLVLARNGVPNDNLVWKDTAVIPVGEAVDLLIEMSNPGKWMLHCHVVEHLGAGMMMVFEVDRV